MKTTSVVICNAFSLNMLPDAIYTDLLVEHLEDLDSAKEIIDFFRKQNIEIKSAVGHASTAAILGDQLGFDVPMNRCNVELVHGMRLIIGQYIGPRLEEGVTTLPDGAEIQWKIVSNVHHDSIARA